MLQSSNQLSADKSVSNLSETLGEDIEDSNVHTAYGSAIVNLPQDSIQNHNML